MALQPPLVNGGGRPIGSDLSDLGRQMITDSLNANETADCGISVGKQYDRRRE